MSSKPVEPQLGAKSFSCPHCGALAGQTFLRAFAEGYETGTGPRISRYDEGSYRRLASMEPKDDQDARLQKRMLEFAERLKENVLSPRGAAALLRLCIQKLMPILGE
jgi:hypothetical protein